MIILFLGDSVRSFSPSRRQYAILGSGILGQIASFERRLRGAAQTPLPLPYPFRLWPGSGTWAERDKREVRDFLYFGRYTPELFLDLGIYMQSLNEKTYIYMEKHLFPSWHNFQIGFLFRPHHTFSWSHLEAFGLLCTLHDWLLCRCSSILDFKVKYLSLFERSLSSRGAVSYPTSLHPVSVLTIHSINREIQLIIMLSQTVRQSKPNNRNPSRYKASEMLAYRVREHNKTA